MKLPIAAEKW